MSTTASKPDTPAAVRVPLGSALDWTDEELDELSEIRVGEDEALMLASVRLHGTRKLYQLVKAAKAEEEAADGATGA